MTDFLASITTEHMIFVFALVVIIRYKEPISSFIHRIIRIDKGGIQASDMPNTQASSSESDSESVQKLLDDFGDLDLTVIKMREEDILDDLKGRIPDVNPDINDPCIKVLIRHLAGVQILLVFERVHNLIFGSQIRLLKKLNEYANVGESLELEFVKSYFREIKLLYPGALDNWDLEEYLRFMLGQSLITFEDDGYHITHLGREYLLWIVRNGKSEDKRL